MAGVSSLKARLHGLLHALERRSYLACVGRCVQHVAPCGAGSDRLLGRFGGRKSPSAFQMGGSRLWFALALPYCRIASLQMRPMVALRAGKRVRSLGAKRY